MDITQILITAGAVVGIVLIALVAIVPTLMEIPSPQAPTDTVRPGNRGSVRTARTSTGGRPAKLHLPV